MMAFRAVGGAEGRAVLRRSGVEVKANLFATLVFGLSIERMLAVRRLSAEVGIGVIAGIRRSVEITKVGSAVLRRS